MPDPIQPHSSLLSVEAPSLMTPAKSAVVSKNIESFLSKEKEAWEKLQKEPKLLILGTSDSGKSTVLKQLKIHHGGGIPESEVENCKLLIRNQIIYSCRTLLLYNSETAVDICDNVQDLLDENCLNNKDLASLNSIIKLFWESETVQRAFKQLPPNRMPETNEYFLGHIDRIFNQLYTPTTEDVLKVRTTTQAISETVFHLKDKILHFYDVSGLKGHRKYWIPYFDNVDFILFVASLSSYDQTMVEDNVTNRLMDSLVVFESIVNNPLLKNAGILLFLNKKDIFEKKVKMVSIKDSFPEYDGIVLLISRNRSFHLSGSILYQAKVS